MPFPTGQGAVKSYDSIFSETESLARGLKNTAQQAVDQSAAGGMNSQKAIHLYNNLGVQRNRIEQVVAGVSTAEANAYAAERYDVASFDITAEYVAMRDALDDVLAWIVANIDAASIITFDTGTRSVTWTAYTAGQTAGLRTVLNALIATID